MSKVRIYDFKGSKEQLKELLTKGLKVRLIEDISDEQGFLVEFLDRPGRKRKYDIKEILGLREEGFSFSSIAEHIGCSKTYVIKVCKERDEGEC